MLNSNVFIFPKTYIIAKEFVSSFKIFAEHPGSNGEAQLKNIIDCVTAFKNVDVENLTSTSILDAINSAYSQSSYLGREIANFLHFLCQLGVNFETSKVYEECYNQQFCKTVLKSDLINMFSFPQRYISYYKNGFFADPAFFSLAFMGIDTSYFADNRMATTIEKFYESIKIDRNHSVRIRKQLCAEMNHLCSMFANTKLDSICNDYLSTISEQNPNSSSMLLVDFLFFLINTAVFDDGRFDFLKSFQNYSGYKLSMLLPEILKDDVPDKFRVCLYKDNSKHYVYINSNSKVIRDLCQSYLSLVEMNNKMTSYIFAHFDESVYPYIVNSISDLNYQTFLLQIQYSRNIKSQESAVSVVGLYKYISQNINGSIFNSNGVSSSILQRHTLSTELYNGFAIASVNPAEEPPQPDKLILIAYDSNNSTIRTTSAYSVDLESIQEPTYRNWVKNYLWYANGGLFAKTRCAKEQVAFLNFVFGIKQGTILSIYGNKTNDLTITSDDALAYKTYVAQKYDSKRWFVILESVQMLLKFVFQQKIGSVDYGVFYNLKCTFYHEFDPSPLNNTELNKLITNMSNRIVSEFEEFEKITVILLLIETEFRLTQILALERKCVVEAGKKGQYIVKSQTKISKGGIDFQSVSKSTAKRLLKIEAETAAWCSDCNYINLAKRLFIIPAPAAGGNGFALLSQWQLNKYLKKCCTEAGIREISASNLRDTYMTKTSKYAINEGLSNLEKSALTGHTTIDTDNSYVKPDLRDMLEACYGIVIGNININGQVVKSLSDKQENIEIALSNGCGFCNNKTCSDYSYLDCLMCKYFIATLDRIPFYQNQIKIMDKRIETALFPHDKEDAVNIKRLLCAYLYELCNLKNQIIERTNPHEQFVRQI